MKIPSNTNYFEYYNEHYNDSTCTYDGVPQLLDTLSDMGIIMAVVTNKAQPFAEKVINKLFSFSSFSNRRSNRRLNQGRC